VPGKLRCSLLCEDIAQEQLFRPILERLFHRVRVEPRKPNGGFTFVLARLLHAAQYIRQRPQEAVGLLVVIDGDETGLQGRLEEIGRVVRSAGFAHGEMGSIAVCVPSRNVETWKLWLHGLRDLDETTDYKSMARRALEDLPKKQLVDAWFDPVSDEQNRLEAFLLPALVHGRTEIKRLQSVARS
jgi:hypothetical protein